MSDSTEAVTVNLREKKRWRKYPCVIKSNHFVIYRDTKVNSQGPKWFCYHPPFFVTAEPRAITHLSAWIWHVLWDNVRCQEPSPHWVRNNTYTILIMLLMAFQYCSHQLYLKTRVEDQSKYICADCEEDLLKCAGRIAHAKVCLSVALCTWLLLLCVYVC